MPVLEYIGRFIAMRLRLILQSRSTLSNPNLIKQCVYIHSNLIIAADKRMLQLFWTRVDYYAIQ